MSTTIMTITPTVLANLHTKLESYRSKRMALIELYRFNIPSGVTWTGSSQSALERGFMKFGSIDRFDAHLDHVEAIVSDDFIELFELYSAKIGVLEYRTSYMRNKLEAFEEECGEFDDALFTLWYQR